MRRPERDYRNFQIRVHMAEVGGDEERHGAAEGMACIGYMTCKKETACQTKTKWNLCAERTGRRHGQPRAAGTDPRA